MFPLKNKSLVDFAQFNVLIHDYAFYFPLQTSQQVTKFPKLDYKPLSFATRQEMLGINANIILNKQKQSIRYVMNLNEEIKHELFIKTQNLQFNLYYYENQSYSPDFAQHMKNKFGELEIEFNMLEHLRYSFTILKNRYLGESIRDVDFYLKYANINNKKSHRDHIFSDIKRFFMGDQSHIEEINTSKLFDYKNSKKIQNEIENYLKVALQGVQEPHDSIVK